MLADETLTVDNRKSLVSRGSLAGFANRLDRLMQAVRKPACVSPVNPVKRQIECIAERNRVLD